MSSQETFSITTLQRMCARSEYLDESDIHMNDKTVSWDGNIIYYKTKKPASTGNEFLIPIQVKGKEYNILPDSDSISYPVDINDLKNYLKNGGVIFFVDAISKTEYNDKMYAKILLPVDIVHIMKGKEEQGSITVHLNHVKTVRELEELCVLFKENRPKQAMVGVGKSIPDYDNISNFTISTLPTPYMNPAIAIAKSPFKYVYTKKDGMEIPVLLTDLVTATESEWLIKIDDKIEQRYPVRHIYELNQTTTRISEIIEFVLTEKSQKTTIRCVEATNYNFETVFQQYVAKLFNDNLSQQLSTEEARLRKLKRDYEEYKNKTKDMTDAIKVLVGKYEDANKEYQTQLLNAIKIPLMVYSGRIIQNYPLGLGIRAVIKTNQLVFEAASKSGSDVYNILSTGQLNGLSIALLLSIKNVYGDTKGLDILLIDDPLQTIDDISAISLADLLTQQGIGQIVLSTHEEAKAALLRYKFKHAGMSVREQNMQALYMKTVTEE